jgi:hypothetical protein
MKICLNRFLAIYNLTRDGEYQIALGAIKNICFTALYDLLSSPRCFLKTIPRLYLSGKFSFVVTARLDTRIEWFLFTKCMLLLLMSLPESTLTWSPQSAPLQ